MTRLRVLSDISHINFYTDANYCHVTGFIRMYYQISTHPKNIFLRLAYTKL